jgi:hypothetical protein
VKSSRFDPQHHKKKKKEKEKRKGRGAHLIKGKWAILELTAFHNLS